MYSYPSLGNLASVTSSSFVGCLSSDLEDPLLWLLLSTSHKKLLSKRRRCKKDSESYVFDGELCVEFAVVDFVVVDVVDVELVLHFLK